MTILRRAEDKLVKIKWRMEHYSNKKMPWKGCLFEQIEHNMQSLRES